MISLMKKNLGNAKRGIVSNNLGGIRNPSIIKRKKKTHYKNQMMDTGLQKGKVLYRERSKSGKTVRRKRPRRNVCVCVFN